MAPYYVLLSNLHANIFETERVKYISVSTTKSLVEHNPGGPGDVEIAVP